MQVVKTVRIPVHYGITKRKLSILNSLTARTTYGVWLYIYRIVYKVDEARKTIILYDVDLRKRIYE